MVIITAGQMLMDAGYGVVQWSNKKAIRQYGTAQYEQIKDLSQRYSEFYLIGKERLANSTSR